jgi:membrane glycosyltransferase
VAGLALAAIIAVASPGLLLAFAPLVVGLALSIPLSVLTSSDLLGRLARRLGLLVTPEERMPPEVLRRLAASAPPAPVPADAVHGALREQRRLWDTPEADAA